METSDEEEEDGQIDKFDIYEDKDRRSTSRANYDDEPADSHDIMCIVLSRDVIAKNYLTPWFEDLVKGWITAVDMFVNLTPCRSLGKILHRVRRWPLSIPSLRDRWYVLKVLLTVLLMKLSLSLEVAPKTIIPYKINEQPANQELVLRHGISEKSFPMNMISNSPLMEVCLLIFSSSVGSYSGTSRKSGLVSSGYAKQRRSSCRRDAKWRRSSCR